MSGRDEEFHQKFAEITTLLMNRPCVYIYRMLNDIALRVHTLELRDVTCYTWDHTVLPVTRHK